jgi:hypothetical protein
MGRAMDYGRFPVSSAEVQIRKKVRWGARFFSACPVDAQTSLNSCAIELVDASSSGAGGFSDSAVATCEIGGESRQDAGRLGGDCFGGGEGGVGGLLKEGGVKEDGGERAPGEMNLI